MRSAKDNSLYSVDLRWVAFSDDVCVRAAQDFEIVDGIPVSPPWRRQLSPINPLYDEIKAFLDRRADNDILPVLKSDLQETRLQKVELNAVFHNQRKTGMKMSSTSDPTISWGICAPKNLGSHRLSRHITLIPQS
jgi:hypothetical protein